MIKRQVQRKMINPKNKTKYRNILASFRKSGKVGKEIQPLSKNRLWEIGQIELSGLKRAMFYDLFISAGRVSEILTTTNSERDVVTDENGEEYYQLDMVNLKNKSRPRKRVIGYFSDKIERKMIDVILDELAPFGIHEKPYHKVYPQKYKRIAVTKEYAKIMIQIGIATKQGIQHIPEVSLFPHLLRHSRAYNLVNQYHYDALELTSFMGWTDTRPAMTYCHANTDTFKQKGRFSK